MSPKTELWLTLLVCGFGGAYFTWRAFGAEGDSQLLYMAFVFVTLIYAVRAVKDVLKKIRGQTDHSGK